MPNHSATDPGNFPGSTGAGPSPHPCKACGVATLNRVYCSTACRVRDLHPNLEARRAEVVTRRKRGESFKAIGQALGITAARASKMFDDYGGV